MAIPIDRVYNTVLDILNKESRGWLPPSEFNNIGSLAQLDLFNKLIYDKAHFKASAKGDMELIKALYQKINVFKRRVSLMGTINVFTLPTDLYQLDTVQHTTNNNTYIAVEVDTDELQYIVNSDKTIISAINPKFIRLGNTVELYPATITTDVAVYYIKTPDTPIWNSIDIGAIGTPLFNISSSTDFELHPSQEDDLIKKILYYAGVSVKEPDVVQAVNNDMTQGERIEKS